MENKKEKNKPVPEQETAADLRHDNMEYAASTDGDDRLDFDDPAYEEEEIGGEELELLEEDSPEDKAYAQVAAETDKQADSDNLPEEDWQQDLPGDNT